MGCLTITIEVVSAQEETSREGGGGGHSIGANICRRCFHCLILSFVVFAENEKMIFQNSDTTTISVLPNCMKCQHQVELATLGMAQ